MHVICVILVSILIVTRSALPVNFFFSLKIFYYLFVIACNGKMFFRHTFFHQGR